MVEVGHQLVFRQTAGMSDIDNAAQCCSVSEHRKELNGLKVCI